ncbi:MAG TPA: multidrug effflux MFS transporter [Gammaproteobacteria bacterium]|nr:multidrug effflux MFS transporter [Gammaproteobacteria bacterium]
MKNRMPSVWLLIFIIGLPIFSETAYSTALVDIAKALSTSENMVEHTLSTYLFGFALGTLIWGNLSDKIGRKPCLLGGYSIYILACLCCYFSPTIEILLLSRFIQAFGGSVGSVIGLAICRDSFTDYNKGKIFSTITSTVAFVPALGPIIGGWVARSFGWPAIFLLLLMIGLAIFCISCLQLPETYKPTLARNTFWNNLRRMLRDPKLMAFCCMVAGCNGIMFSYFSEGAFYCIDYLNTSEKTFSYTFLGIAFSAFLGGRLSRWLHNWNTSFTLLKKGAYTTCLGTMLFSGVAIGTLFLPVSSALHLTFYMITLCITLFGIGLMIPNVLNIALEDYQDNIGTASAIFGCGYYLLITLLIFILATLHNDTIFPLPFYQFCIAMGMVLIITLSTFKPTIQT